MLEGCVCVYEVFILDVLIPFEINLGNVGPQPTMAVGKAMWFGGATLRERRTGCAVLLGSYLWSYGRELKLCDDPFCPGTHCPRLCCRNSGFCACLYPVARVPLPFCYLHHQPRACSKYMYMDGSVLRSEETPRRLALHVACIYVSTCTRARFGTKVLGFCTLHRHRRKKYISMC